MRKIALSLLLVVWMFGAGSAVAATPRQAATDQYGDTPVIGSGSTSTTPTTPTETAPPVAGAGTPGTPVTPSTPATPTADSPDTPPGTAPDAAGTAPDSAGAAPDSAGGATGPGNGGSTPAGSTCPTSAALPTRVSVVEYGFGSPTIHRHIKASVGATDLQVRFHGRLTQRRFAAFMTSPAFKRLSADGPRAAGEAFGAQLVNPTSATRATFTRLFGAQTPFVAVTRVVLTRPAAITGDQAAFLMGLAAGLASSGVPVVYVERSDAKRSFRAAYQRLGIPTVSDVETQAGEGRLTELLERSAVPTATSAACDTAPANRVAVVQYGTLQPKVRRDIASSMRQAGLRTLFRGRISKARFNAFVASPVLALLSPDGLGQAGQAFGAQLVTPTPAARTAFPALFGPGTPFVPVIRAVLVRAPGMTEDQVTFTEGVAKGLLATGVPLAYVERDDVKTSYVDEFRKLGVLTVDDVNTQAGQLRLAQIMLAQTTSQRAVDAVKFKTAAAVTTDADGSTGVVPWAVLVVLLAGVGFTMTGVRRRGRRRHA